MAEPRDNPEPVCKAMAGLFEGREGRWKEVLALHNALLSTLVAAIPVVVLLASIAWLHIRIHYAALLGLAVALLVALFVYRMPVKAAAATTAYGAAYGLFPIGWIILNLIFLYQLTVDKGLFAVLRGDWQMELLSDVGE